MIYREVATDAETKALADRLRAGIGWGDVKKEVARALVEGLAAKREKYLSLMADKSQIDRVLEDGARRARSEAQNLMREVRQALGAKPTPAGT